MSRSLLRSTAVISALTFVSRILGFVRDMVIARYFGASGITDAFFIAFRIPNLMRRLFAEGAFTQAFVPVLNEYKTKESEQSLRELIANVTGTLGGILLLVTAVGMIASPWLVYGFAAGFTNDAGQYTMTVDMLRIMFPYLLFISLTACAGGILNTFGNFSVPALTPVFLNLCMIGAVIGFSHRAEAPILSLAWGVFVAGIIQFVYQLPYLAKIGMLVRPRWGWRHPAVQRVLRIMVPSVIGSSAAQINMLVSSQIGSFLVAGSVSWLSYSDRLVEFPLGIIGVALGTVILPNLSRIHASEKPQQFSHMLDWGLRWTVLTCLPCTVALWILAKPILVTLFQYGAFSATDADMSMRSLRLYVLGLSGFIAVKVLAPGFYARGDTRTPLKIATVSIGFNMIMGPLCAFTLGLGHAGLALAAGAASLVNAAQLLFFLCRHGVYRFEAGWLLFILRVVIATIALGAVCWWASHDGFDWLAASLLQRVLRLGMWIGAGSAVYLAVLWALRVRLSQLNVRAET